MLRPPASNSVGPAPEGSNTMPVLNSVDEIATNEKDPAGHRYPWIQSIEDESGARTPPTGRQPLGLAIETGRLVAPGDRVTFRCAGIDPHARELCWWVHPFGVEPAPRVRGDQLELTWVVEPVSSGPRVYVGIGMAAESHHHRQGGLDGQGYDGWVLFYYRVAHATLPSGAPTAFERTALATDRPRRPSKRSPLVHPGLLLNGRP